MPNQTGWSETASDTNAETTATRAAESGRQHIIYGVSASFATTATALLQVKDGSTVIWQDYVYDKLNLTFPQGLSATKGNAVSAVLAASGGPIQKVNIHGITKG
jgi:selenophosphate synthase